MLIRYSFYLCRNAIENGVQFAYASCADTRKFRENYTDIMTADALLPCIARSPATMVFVVQVDICSHQGGFPLLAPVAKLQKI